MNRTGRSQPNGCARVCIAGCTLSIDGVPGTRRLTQALKFILSMGFSMENRSVPLFVGCFLLALLPVCCAAQIDRAGLSGTVLDSTGRRIPGAQIGATQIATGVVLETINSSNGTHDIPELPVGFYRVVCSASGFQQITMDGLEQTV
jgi:hypothetical protein